MLMDVIMLLLLALFATNSQERVLPITNADGRVVASGVLLNPWTVLTAAHAVDELHSVVFIQCGDEEGAGFVSRRGRVHDLALVTLYKPCRKVDTVELANEEPAPGDHVVIEGYPARELTHTKAVVQGYQLTAVGARFGFGLFWIAMVLQGDVRPGSSGGPVLSKSGKLCGIVHGFSTTAPGKPGAAVPLRTIAQFLAHEES
jgi:V8-like Glu-specific endopeptidase